MKKFHITILKFLPFALVAYLVLLFAWGKTPLPLRKNLNYRIGAYGHMHSRMKDVKVAGKTEVIILGSSHSYRGFDTRIFNEKGIRAFNLGSSSQTPIQSLMLLEKYVDRLSPKLVILEVFPEIFGLDGVESSLEIVANEQIDIHVAKMVFRVNHIKTYNSFLYGWFRQITGVDKDFVQPPNQKKDHYITGSGYVARDMEFFKHVTYPTSEWELNKNQLKAFDKILQLLREKNIAFILVQAPYTSDLYNSKVNNATIDSLFKSKGDYINFNNQLQLDDSLHFYDADHLNQEGVKIFNDSLLNWMAQQNLPVKIK